jgi:hypothetical protein
VNSGSIVAALLPELPRSYRRSDLEAVGFAGWQTWEELRANDFDVVPSSPATYVVYRAEEDDPAFLDVNPGGRFKRRDPTVKSSVLAAKWVPGANVMYLGKADVANRRLAQFARFGGGAPVGHWGGRYIWQLANANDLMVAWHPITWTETAREYEKRLLARFAELHHGMLPFANLSR